jgi:hypothetical protein
LNYLIAKVLFSVGAGDRPIGVEFSIQASSTVLKKVKQNRRSGKNNNLYINGRPGLSGLSRFLRP